MKGIIIYKSKYGATKQYAEWLGDELNIPIADPDEVTSLKLAQYDYIIIGSSVYIGKLLLYKWLNKNKSILINKKLFLFVVCATDLKERLKLRSFIEVSVPAEIRNQCEVFFLRGKVVYKRLSFIDKLLIAMRASMAKTNEEKATIYNMDLLDKEALIPLINAVVEYQILKNDFLTSSHKNTC